MTGFSPGALLSEALRAQGVFPTVYTASIFAGERSGNLVEVITRYHPVRKDDSDASAKDF